MNTFKESDLPGDILYSYDYDGEYAYCNGKYYAVSLDEEGNLTYTEWWCPDGTQHHVTKEEMIRYLRDAPIHEQERQARAAEFEKHAVQRSPEEESAISEEMQKKLHDPNWWFPD